MVHVPLRVAAGQTEPNVEDVEATLRQAERTLSIAKSEDTRVLVLPELANSGYNFKDLDEVRTRAEPIPDGDFSEMLRDWSADDRLVAAGICEVDRGLLYNSAAIFAGGKHVVTYRKAHLFSREREFFRPGNREPPVVSHWDYRFGVMICFDWAFPEQARILSLKGAQVILHPSNLVLDYGQSAMVTRSIENCVFTVTANRVGTERGLTFTGQSQITGTRGEILARASRSECGLIWADIEPSRADDKMITEYNHLIRDRRPELYRRLTRRS